MNSETPNALQKRLVCNFTWLKYAALTISSRRFAHANDAGVDSVYVVLQRGFAAT
jgi:hypothetical protein